MKFSAHANVMKLISVTALLIAGCGVQNDSSEMKSDAAINAPKVVEFHIPAGTGKKAWNTKETMVVAHVGDTVRLINDDSIGHRLHTNGAPCGHGDQFEPGKSFDCVISKKFDPGTTPLYDHNVGPAAAFWIKAD